jgi:hypothetical protein
VQPADFFDISESLVTASRGRPKRVFLRRAVSTTYYALFHTLARSCADSLVGVTAANRSSEAWHQVYRSLDHGLAKKNCSSQRIREFPVEIRNFAELFCEMQAKRHAADYDPSAPHLKSTVSLDIARVKDVVSAFQMQPIREKRAFSVFVLFKTRRD